MEKNMILEKKICDYLVAGMKEEREKDPDNELGNRNLEVRQHIGMWQETTKDVIHYCCAIAAGDEEEARLYYRALVDHYFWWRDYFDISPQYAREVQERERQRQREEFEKNRNNYEYKATSAIEALKNIDRYREED